MNITSKIKSFLEKLQNLPEHSKKIILWSVVAVFAVILGYFWIINAVSSFDKISKNVAQVKIPEIQVPNVQPQNIQTTGLPAQSQQTTESWKTYTNEKYSFEIKYPADWSFRDYESGAAFFPTEKLSENTTGNGSLNVGFNKRGSDYCKIPFEDYVKIAGPSEIQNYESVNTINSGVNGNGIVIYEITWNYTDTQGKGKISLPIDYFQQSPENCGGIEAFLNDNNYSDIYNKIISSFNFTK